MPLNRRQSLFAAVIAGFALLVLTAAARTQEKLYRPDLSAHFLDSSLRTDWYGVYLQNKKIGYGQNLRKRDGDKIIDEQVMSLKLASFGKKVELLQRQVITFQAAAPYRMLTARLTEQAGPLTKITTFTWNPAAGGYDTVYEADGQKRKEVLKDIDFTLADEAATDVWVTQKPKVGDVIRTRQFDLSEQKIDVQTSKILSSKESLAGGVKIHLYEVETESKLREIKSISRYDDQGVTLSATLAVFELRKETEEQAKNTEYSQDLFVMGMVKIDKGLGSTSKVAELIVEVDREHAEVFQNGPRQCVVSSDNGSLLLKVGKKYGKEQKATEAEIKESLAETNRYPISHPKIKALAEKVTAGATTDEQKVAKIVAFAHDFVKPHLAASDPQIHDLLEKKQGDCKSYALLFNNLARAAGVPSREVSGLLYVGDDYQSFGGHAWNEVVLNGMWVPIDACWNETEVNATHVCFGSEHRATKNLLNTLGKLSFRLVEVKKAE
jgi:hypothetical protein